MDSQFLSQVARLFPFVVAVTEWFTKKLRLHKVASQVTAWIVSIAISFGYGYTVLHWLLWQNICLTIAVGFSAMGFHDLVKKFITFLAEKK